MADPLSATSRTTAPSTSPALSVPPRPGAITEITRRALIDDLVAQRVPWWGALTEPGFLGRLYDLDRLPSYDSRFKDAAADIWQHRENNLDWEDDWVFGDDRFELDEDGHFLRFLAETVHPVVRRKQNEASELVALYNKHLAPDGWEIAEVSQISGRPVYEARSRLSVPSALRTLRKAIRAGDREYLDNQITRMEASIENDPELAIGTAKELVETACKSALVALGVPPEPSWDLPRLVKEAGRALKVTPEDIPDSARAADSIRKTLGSLGGVVAGIAELRNAYGTGHGRPLGSSGLHPRHARLAVGAASTLAVFLFETYEQRSTSTRSA